MTRRLSIRSAQGDGRVGSPRVRGGVDLRGRGRGRTSEGVCFPGNDVNQTRQTTLDFLDSLQTRPDPDLGPQCSSTSYPVPRPNPLRPDLTLESAEAPFWALSYLKDL